MDWITWTQPAYKLFRAQYHLKIKWNMSKYVSLVLMDILKGPAGQTSRHWKAKAVAALANYLWKAPLERSPNQSPRGNSSPGTVGPPSKKTFSHPSQENSTERKGCLGGVDGCGALRRLLHEAKFRLGATTSESRPTTTPEFPRPPRRGPAS